MVLGCLAERVRGPIVGLACCAAVLAAASVAAQEAIDQQNPGSAFTCLNPGFYTMSQGFTPSFSRMNFGEIHIDSGKSTELIDGDFSLRVLRNGSLIRESEHVVIPAVAGTDSDFYRFHFPSEAYLVPGQPYELQLVNHSNTSYFSWCQSQNDTYAGGAPMVSPPGGGSGDFLFRTGMESIFGPPQAVTHGDGYMLFESVLAPQGPATGGGISVNSNFFSGVNFEISEPTRLSRIGGYFGFGSGQIFGAVVQATGFASVPNPPDLSGSDVLATTPINLPVGGGEAWGDVDVTLDPGWYAILFGSGKFGATGSAALRDLVESNGPYWSAYSIRQSDGQRFFQSGEYRIFGESAPAAGTAQARPAFDTQAEQFAGQWILTDGDSDITGARLDFYGQDERALLEFDLSAVPEGATVTSVELQLVPAQLTSGGGSGPRLFFHGYSGDGAASAADAAVPLNEIGSTPIITTFDPFEVALSPAYVQSLVDQGATHLGLMVRGDNNGHRVHFSTWEDGRPDQVPLLTIEFSLAGDYDGDGAVDASDYAVWKESFGDTGSGLAADGNGDGVVNAADYVVWRDHLNGGMTGSASVEHALVPEPSTALLLIAALVLASFVARGRRR